MSPITGPAELHETHISVLVFIGDRAYKLKKPVDMGFLDFSSREKRQEACRREVELNRRLAPDVYLGVADVLGVEGELSDHLVVMARMPSERRLSTLVSNRDPDVAQNVRAVARLMAEFHNRADRSPEIDDAATVDAVRTNWEDSFTVLNGSAGSVLDPTANLRVMTLVRRYLDGREPLFASRVSGGHVCDGHGDLQAADIFCLDDGPRVLDCIEFSDRLRHGDVIADVGFLAMDLEQLGAPELAEQFLAWYREFSDDQCPESLVNHYVAYRAHIRAKVNCLRAEQLEGAARDEVVEQANHLLRVAHRHLERGRTQLVLVGGAPGTGKSTLAVGVGEAQGWTVLRSDEIRKELAGLDANTSARASFGEGLYTAERTDVVYEEMLRRAQIALSRGESVVLDASWTKERHRGAARQLAVATAADLTELRCDAPAALTEERLLARMAKGGDPSDADPAVAAQMAGRAEPWPEAHLIDTSPPPETVVRNASAVLC